MSKQHILLRLFVSSKLIYRFTVGFMCGIDEYPEAPAYKITSKISLSSTEVLIIHMAENECKVKEF